MTATSMPRSRTCVLRGIVMSASTSGGASRGRQSADASMRDLRRRAAKMAGVPVPPADPPDHRRRSRFLTIGAAVVVVAALAVGLFLGSRPLPVPAAQAPTATPSPSASTTEQSALAGLHIVLDPGHNGGNAGAPDEMAKQVDDGRGGRKACNTAGTSTTDGYPEHAFSWDVAQRTRDLLETAGAEVTLTRDRRRRCRPVRGRAGPLGAGARRRRARLAARRRCRQPGGGRLLRHRLGPAPQRRPGAALPRAGDARCSTRSGGPASRRRRPTPRP